MHAISMPRRCSELTPTGVSTLNAGAAETIFSPLKVVGLKNLAKSL